MSRADAAIGIFDSGVGGLTVVRELWRRLPAEALVYFGDTARVPYGPKSPETVCRYAAEAAAYLLSYDVKMIVVACNTATAHAIHRLEAELPVPVIGVVGPGARAAARATRSGRIGIIGTVGTIGSGAYDRAVRRHLPHAKIFAQSCPLFVPFVEEGWVDREAMRLVAEEYLRPIREVDVDVLIMGCTHYPLLQPILAEILGPSIQLVDSAAETAADVEHLLREANLLRGEEESPVDHFIVSDSPIHFREMGRYFLGGGINNVERFDVDGFIRQV
jgi:glutamate racemase